MEKESLSLKYKEDINEEDDAFTGSLSDPGDKFHSSCPAPVPGPGGTSGPSSTSSPYTNQSKPGPCKPRGLLMMRVLEKYFKYHGLLVARNPVLIIFLSLSCVCLASVGLLRFYEESDLAALWIPQTSEFKIKYDWIQQTFPQKQRFHQVIFRAENVLEPGVLIQMLEVLNRIKHIRTRSGRTWKDICFRVPIIAKPKCLGSLGTARRRRKRSEDRVLEDPDEWLAEEDWGEDLTQTDSCQGFNLSTLSLSSLHKLAEVGAAISSGHFSVELATSLSREFYPEPYCSMVKQAETVCFQESILELWGIEGEIGDKSEQIIRNLTLDDVLETINTKNTSGVFMVGKNFKKMLSNIRYDSTGRIVGAGISTISWLSQVNMTNVKLRGSAQRGELVDEFSHEFEGEMIEALTDRSQYSNVSVFVHVHRMFLESLEGQAFKDAKMLILGYFIVLLYVLVMLGTFSCVEQKIWLSIGGVLGVGFGIVASYGICSAVGFFYSAAHTVLPFLLLGIGIDDMFVIVQTLSTLSSSEQNLELEDRISVALSHAGVAITITSLTDFIAFSIGATTSLPALRSFCVYAGVGIFVIFLLQVSWFTALLFLDEKRVDKGRNGLICCYEHKNFTRRDKTQEPLMEKLFGLFTQLLLTKVMKVLVLLCTLSFLTLGIVGLSRLRMEFKPEWLMNPESEISGWWEATRTYFPSNGETGFIFLQGINYPENWERIDTLVSKFKNQTDVINSIDSWQDVFKDYVESLEAEAMDWRNLTDDYFQSKLSQFLFSPVGAKYRLNFLFDGDLECGQPAPRVLLSAIQYSHVLLQESSEWVPAMDWARDIAEESDITGEFNLGQISPAFAIAPRYANWETDKIIGEELYQNLLSSILAIFITLLILLGSIKGACIVIFCVAGTLVNVAGFMHFWGLTIDVISCNSLVISIGLCVDFSVHIAHGFLTTPGDRDTRVLRTMRRMGPAVFNGGISTLLAFILLATSSSYVFLSFFKIFFLICIFGLFHGLISLPVILSLVGPINQGRRREKVDTGSEFQDTQH